MKAIISAILALTLIGCSNESESSTNEEMVKSVESVQKVTEAVKEESKEIVESVAETTSETVEKVTQKIEEGTQEIVHETKEVVHATKEAIQATLEPELGAKLFAKCTSCHGQNAEKKALNKSLVIKGWSVDKTVAAINGYKDGTYGREMKGLMKGQVANLSKEEVHALAEYVSTL